MKLRPLTLTAAACATLPAASWANDRLAVLEADDYARHVEFFNQMEPERVVNLIPNSESWEWMEAEIPFFTCPDADLEEIYYFRWWALRKHLKEVGPYKAYTEFIELETNAWFIPPERTIASALGHHFMETRWLQNQENDDSYLDYWMQGKDGEPQGHFHRYSSWLMDALWQRAEATGDFEFLLDRFDLLNADYARWEEEKRRPDGLFWQYDVWDAMEESISGSRHQQNVRPTINSYMFGNAVAMEKLSKLAGDNEQAEVYAAKARELRNLVQEHLWNPENKFFEVVYPDGEFADAREAIGFIPWYFNLPEPGQGYEVAWEQLTDPLGFWAPYGLTTAERRHPRFRSYAIGTCEWDGALWPYATSQTLVALANVLRNYPDTPVSAHDYYDAFVTYTRSQRYAGLPYIGEYQDETSGQWLKGRAPRSYYYHHSTYADLLITGLVGMQPQADGSLVVDPLLPEGTWNWFALDGVPYHDHQVTIIWDADGSQFGQGAGFQVLIDGEQVAHAEELQRLEIKLP
ncbi:MAG: trehalase family glycosidase [Verrucomicrobiota bacterium JB022]|nr:trehalase family glycosidase [Verrucomicrobiota bacterium JB022]